MEKYIKDGMVAVVIAPSFGGGWSSWNAELKETLVFHPAIVQMVLDGRREEIDEDWLVAQTSGCMNNPLPKNHIYINNTIEELMGYFEEIKNRHNYDR